MTTKKKLQAFFDSKQDDLKYIQMYEENLVFFNELLTTGRAEELEYVLPIKLLKYADPLNLTGDHTKALRILKEVERDLPKLKGHSKLYEQYDESLKFLKGVCLSRMKRFKESNVLFAELLKRKNTNDSYTNWFRSNQKAMISAYTTPIMMVAFIVYLALFVFGLVREDASIAMIKAGALAVALLALVGPWAYGKWLDRRTVPGH